MAWEVTKDQAQVHACNQAQALAQVQTGNRTFGTVLGALLGKAML